MDPQFRINKRNDRYATLPSDIHTALLNIQNSTSLGMCSKFKLLPGTGLPCNNYTGLVWIVPGLCKALSIEALRREPARFFQVPISVACGSFGVAISFDAHLVDFLPRRLFIRETLGAYDAFMNVVELWKARVLTYNNVVLVYSLRYEHVEANCQELAFGARVCKSWCEKVQLRPGSRCSYPRSLSGAVLHAHRDAFSFISQVAWFRFSSSFAIPPVSTIRHFVGTVQDFGDKLGGIT